MLNNNNSVVNMLVISIHIPQLSFIFIEQSHIHTILLNYVPDALLRKVTLRQDYVLQWFGKTEECLQQIVIYKVALRTNIVTFEILLEFPVLSLI